MNMLVDIDYQMIMNKKINKIIEERYLDGKHIVLYDKNNTHLVTTIEVMLAMDKSVTQYSIKYDEISDDPTICYISGAYIKDDTLEHFIYIVKAYYKNKERK